MKAYLDNSATTRCSEAACRMMVKLLTEDYGNPSSLHGMGMKAENYIKEAKTRIAKTLKVSEKEIIFTSGGTESNNMALIGAAMANKRAGMHIITSSIEHASVASPLQYLEDQGFSVTYLPVDSQGVISLEALRQELKSDTILVSLMQVNNEIGTIEPIAEAVSIIKEINPNTLIHVDGIQSYGKMNIYPRKLGIDLLSVSGHKIHGPKGSGFLYIKEKTKVKPVIYGGGQQNGMRSGTENVPAIAGLGVAAEEIYRDSSEKIEKLYRLRTLFTDLAGRIEGVTINGPEGSLAAPHIVSVSVDGIRSEVLLHALEAEGVYVSAGSACSSNKPAVSHTLMAIGLKKELLDSTIRFSLCVNTTEEEITYALDCMKKIVPALRKYTRY